jgi:hypothetical protein
VERKSVKTSTVLILVGLIATIVALVFVFISWMTLSGAWNDFIYLISLLESTSGISISLGQFITLFTMIWIYFTSGINSLSQGSSFVLISVIILIIAIIILLVGWILAIREKSKTPAIIAMVGWIAVIIGFILVLISWTEIPSVSSIIIFFVPVFTLASVSSMLLIAAIVLIIAVVIQLVSLISAMREK